MVKVFTVYRQEDESGVSGTGHVITGIEYENGKVSICWLSDKSSVTVFDDYNTFLAIHILQHPNNRSVIREMEINTDDGQVLTKRAIQDTMIIDHKNCSFCDICKMPIQSFKTWTGIEWTHLDKREFGHVAKKSEQRGGETIEECVERKVPIIMEEDSSVDQEQAVAIAFSMCSDDK